MSNLYSHIQAALLADPASTAIDVSGREISGGQLELMVDAFANALLSLGILPGDRVAAQVEKSLENIVLYLATLRVGATYLPLNSAYRAPEVEYFLSDAKPRVFVATPDREAELIPVAKHSAV